MGSVSFKCIIWSYEVFFNLKCVIALNNDAKMSGILTETDFINESEVVSETSVHNSSVGTEGDKWSWDSTSVLYVEKKSS